MQIVDEFQRYVATYSTQKGYEDYEDETFLNDMLYGLGIAIDNGAYGWAGGYVKFKKKVLQGIVNTKDGSTTTLSSKGL